MLTFSRLLSLFILSRPAKSFTSIVMGDFNFNLRNTDNPQKADYINTMISHLFTPMNCEQNTRVTNVSQTLIDQVWVNTLNRVQDSFVINDIFVSDHLTNGISLIDRHNPGSTMVKTRKLTASKEEAFMNKLRDTD